MNEIISKELLSEVLDIKVIKIGNVTGLNNLWYGYTNMGDTSDFINIYELAYRCKEWAVKNNYEIESTIQISGDIYATVNWEGKYKWEHKEFNAHTEQEAIFLACEWILKESK